MHREFEALYLQQIIFLSSLKKDEKKAYKGKRTKLKWVSGDDYYHQNI